MKIRFSSALTAMGLALSVAVASAQTPSDSAATETSTEATETAAVKERDGDKIVCKAVKETGSRIPTRICRTKDQWAGITKDNTEAAVNTLNRNSFCANPSGPC
jgi:hypothetical protein